MIETLFNAKGADETRVKRAFKWVITFRDFPAGSWQEVDSLGMMEDALTLFTKGRAEFYLDGVRRGDRVPGILSSEHEPFPAGGWFKIVYVEPTTRLCIPRKVNRGQLPMVKKIELQAGDSFEAPPGAKYLVCLGKVSVADKLFDEEQSFSTTDTRTVRALEYSLLLEFENDATR